MPVQGLVRLRKHQFGRQSVLGTSVPATRAYGWTGVPSVERNWTDPEVDVGSLDPVEMPYLGEEDVTWSETTPTLKYNDIPRSLAAIFGGNVSPTGGGTAKTWTHEPASESVDPLDLFTGQFGDDVLTDWYQFIDGVAESVEFVGEEGLGPISSTINWRFGTFASTGATDRPVVGTVPTAGLSVAMGDPIVYLKDMAIHIADTEAGLAAGQVTDALHAFTLNIAQEWDLKRWANGDQSFAIDDYGRGPRTITLECTWSKTADTVGTGSESDDWMSDAAVLRYVQLIFVSTEVAQTPSTFYGWTVTLPLTYRTREEGEIGGNTVVILNGTAHFDPDDLDAVFQSVLVCTLTDAELGTIAS
jgi:hypothetical protein